jgi:alkaline phosphatase
MITRKDFLKQGALLGGAAFTTLGMRRAADVARPASGKTKNVIFLVSDGMSAGTLAMADLMIRETHGRSSHWMDLYHTGRAKRSLMDMASANSVVTDSAAAASSWGCGKRIVNGAVNTGPDGQDYAPLIPIMKLAGKATGLVTSTRITHATPAGFIANVRSRAMEDEIAAQMHERGADVIFGGGMRHFSADKRRDGKDLFGAFTASGYHTVRTKAELAAVPADGKPVIGLFTDSHLPYEVDRLNIPELKRDVPSLAELTDTALKRLSAKPNGFLLQVEGGRVDHAAHGNCAAGLVFDQIAFDEAVGVAVAFAADRDDTLVIVASDHGNANPGLNGEGSNYGGSLGNLLKLNQVTRSNEWIRDEWARIRPASVAELRDQFAAWTSFDVKAEHAEILAEALQGTNRAIYYKMGTGSGVMGQIVASFTGINFIGDAHTADYVELAAFGPGSEGIGGFVKNTDLFTLILEATGVEVF